jgi:hypothetical protein
MPQGDNARQFTFPETKCGILYQALSTNKNYTYNNQYLRQNDDEAGRLHSV